MAFLSNESIHSLRAKIRPASRLRDTRLEMTAVPRSLALPFLFLGLGLGFSGCTTSAVAIDQCREVEAARCESSVPCGVIELDDVEECKRFYYDQCLHGIQGPEEPTAQTQTECVELIQNSGKEALAALLAAELAETEEERNDALKDQVRACLVVAVPWNAEPCDFIKPEEKGMGGESQEDK